MSDAHKGGDLYDMAKDGTSIPGDAGQQRVIPSVPNPRQQAEDEVGATNAGLGAIDAAGAADNATDIPRNPKDKAPSDGIISGTGHEMPAEIGAKNTHFGADNPQAKGSQRYGKHARQKESDLDKGASATSDVTPAPGEEADPQDIIRDRKGA